MPPVPPVDISSEDTPAVPQDHPRRRMVSGNIQLQSSPSPSLLFLALPLRHHSGPLIRNIMSGTSFPEKSHHEEVLLRGALPKTALPTKQRLPHIPVQKLSSLPKPVQPWAGAPESTQT